MDILEREVMLRSLLIGNKALLIEPIVAWVAPKLIVRVILLGGVGRVNVLTTKEWADLSVMLLSWNITFAGLFLYRFLFFFWKMVQSSLLTSKTGLKDPSVFEFSKCTVIEGSRYQVNPRVSPWV